MTPTYVDTSALAKWYLNEEYSDEVEQFVHAAGPVHISSLTQVEMRSLLARRRRNRDIAAELELKIVATIDQEISDGHLILHPVNAEYFDEAARMIASMPETPLATLDALHLSVARRAGLDSIATADKVMAKAAAEQGLEVKLFG